MISIVMGDDLHVQYGRVFDHFDEDKDGKISALELQRCIECIGGNLSLAEAESAVVTMDSDGDGLLSLQDFVNVVEGAAEEEKVDDLRSAFRLYEEKEGCGCITPRSLKRMLSRIGASRSVDDCEVMIAKFDINGDGVLNFDEFRNMMVN